MSNLQPKRVLIVDDDPHLAQLLAIGLSDQLGQYELHVALTPEQALEYARQWPLDLLITDFSMPGADGLQLIDAIRQISPNISVMLMTAFRSDRLEQEAAARGVQKFVPKPFHFTDVRDMVLQILERVDHHAASLPPAPEQIQQEISRELTQLALDTDARCVLLLTVDGYIIESAGDLSGLDVQVMATLMAADFVAVTEISRLLGNPRSFDAVNYESKDDNIYSCAVDAQHLLVVIFGLTIKPGMVWYYTKKMIEQLRYLLDQVQPPTFSADSPAPDFSAAFDMDLFN